MFIRAIKSLFNIQSSHEINCLVESSEGWSVFRGGVRGVVNDQKNCQRGGHC